MYDDVTCEGMWCEGIKTEGEQEAQEGGCVLGRGYVCVCARAQEAGQEWRRG